MSARLPLSALVSLAILSMGCMDVAIQSSDHDRDQDGFDNIADGGQDCNDSNPEIYPGAEEICDLQDNDCDTLTDCEDPDLPDGDGDGSCVCEDCNDEDESNFPGNEEACDGHDNDCDGFADCADPDVEDADGDGACVCTDCDDADDNNFPGNPEVCDDADNNCDDEVDNGLNFIDWYEDADGDGHGDVDTLVYICDGPPGAEWVQVGDDCDDDDPENYPGNNEACDGQDNDCDGQIDNDVNYDDWYYDGDGDGYGDPGVYQNGCQGNPGPDWVQDAEDCDDSDAAINPAAAEDCDLVDSDCDGLIGCNDPEVQDADGDGYCVCDDCDDLDTGNYPGNTETCDGSDNDCNGLADCDDPGVADTDGDGACICDDCDDNDPLNYPGNPEVCDSQDNDCDGFSDCADSDMADDDGDGVCVCFDCDDNDADAFPGNAEACDGTDNDCDGIIPADETTDTDNDGFMACEDCNDVNDDVYPGGTEICDGQDNDCDGSLPADEVDADGDGYYQCEDCDDLDPLIHASGGDPDGDGYDECTGDCDNNDANVHPNATETCDYLDNNCDGDVDEGYLVGGKYTQFTDCGFCGNDCNTYSFDHADTDCDTALATPECVPDCDYGYYDANGDYGDGCECIFINGNDDPFDGIDADCSGDDGDHNDAIHVSLWGSIGATGSLVDPIRDIQEGIDEAVVQGLDYVLVAQGAYYESVELEPGITLVGGYSYFFDEYDESLYETIIDGQDTNGALPGALTMYCSGNADQRIQGLHLIGTTPDDLGESSYGLYLYNCDNDVTIVNNDIEARPGEDGVDGGSGTNASDGNDGNDGLDAQLTYCNSSPQGGSGGTKTCYSPSPTQNVNGGDGGDTLCQIVYGGYTGFGASGLGTSPGAGGERASHCEFPGTSYVSGCSSCTVSNDFGPGGVGEVGAEGAHGNGGAGCPLPDGNIVGYVFEGNGGDSGDVGLNGSGGGGGGAGAGAAVHNTCGSQDVSGGTGGGAGSGGCGSGGGYPGDGGGGSFAVFLVYSSNPATYPTLTGNTFTADAGGEGGWGGAGGVGGDGGIGGIGGDMVNITPYLWAGRMGGNGGNGGDGGHGGGGGGGCGGPSYGLYVAGANPSNSYGNGNSISYGGGGNGGTGGYGPGANNGGDGLDGSDGNKNF